MDRAQLKGSIERELKGNLLPFWRQRSLDPSRGGFVAEMATDGILNESAPKGLILNARLLWTFSNLYRELDDDRDLDLAQRAYDYLQTCFFDRDRGGYIWRVSPDGKPLESSKKMYGQAFTIYALSEYYRATGSVNALARASELFGLIESYAYDRTHGGYIETLSRNWIPAEDMRLSDRDMNTDKSMNNHLHVLEAYTNLYRIRPDTAVSDRIQELIDLFGARMLAPSGHFHKFFDKDWTVRSDTYTYGHDIEGAWMLCDAADALNNDRLRLHVSRWAVDIASAVCSEALDDEGGLAYEGRSGAVVDPHREWWPQAEAMLGFWYAYKITGDEKYAEVVAHLWEFIQRRMVDRELGEWFWRVFADGSPDLKKPKISE